MRLLLNSLNKSIRLPLVLTVLSGLLMGCAQPLVWPESPLYPEQTATGRAVSSLSRDQAIEQIVGHYAHFDVVAYEETSGRNPMRTFITSYGFTDFFVADGNLYEQDQFCHAKHSLNYKTVQTSFSDAATQAIIPPVQAVELSYEQGQWQIFRPATPTLIGVSGDPSQPLPDSINPEQFTDDDGDGHPGVTVDLLIGGFIKGEIYIARREIFANRLTLMADGTLAGHVIDASEQRVLGASMKMLAKPSDPHQYGGADMNPLLLVPIPESLDTCEALMAQADQWFPPAPVFD